MRFSTTKEIAWAILQSSMLWYEGADPEYYGYPKKISDPGKKLADALFKRADKLYSKTNGEIK